MAFPWCGRPHPPTYVAQGVVRPLVRVLIPVRLPGPVCGAGARAGDGAVVAWPGLRGRGGDPSAGAGADARAHGTAGRRGLAGSGGRDALGPAGGPRTGAHDRSRGGGVAGAPGGRCGCPRGGRAATGRRGRRCGDLWARRTCDLYCARHRACAHPPAAGTVQPLAPTLSGSGSAWRTRELHRRTETRPGVGGDMADAVEQGLALLRCASHLGWVWVRAMEEYVGTAPPSGTHAKLTRNIKNAGRRRTPPC
jgi:hypothetical protein